MIRYYRCRCKPHDWKSEKISSQALEKAKNMKVEACYAAAEAFPSGSQILLLRHVAYFLQTRNLSNLKLKYVLYKHLPFSVQEPTAHMHSKRMSTHLQSNALAARLAKKKSLSCCRRSKGISVLGRRVSAWKWSSDCTASRPHRSPCVFRSRPSCLLHTVKNG